MKLKFLLLLLPLLIASCRPAAHVKTYSRSDGTVVKAHTKPMSSSSKSKNPLAGRKSKKRKLPKP